MPRFTFLIGLLLLSVSPRNGSTLHAAASVEAGPCAKVPHADHPSVLLSNEDMQVRLFLPDPSQGYYRATRFDWSGVVACATYNGHTYFGEWFKRYDPLVNDSITGPVEEFRSDDGAIGYANAAPGGLFIKPGVGVLRKLDDGPYKFGVAYPLVDPGTWTVHRTHRTISFQQRLNGPNGIAYIYTKTVLLSLHGSIMTLRHTLRNIGHAGIRTDVYDHDFFMLDSRPTGPGMTIRFPFEPTLEVTRDSAGMTDPAAHSEGKAIVYTRELSPGQVFASYLSGYTAYKPDYDFVIEDTTTGVGVEQSSPSPLVKLYLWSIRSTICPEAYIHLDVPSGKRASWTIQYRLFGPAKVRAAAAPAPLPN